MFNMLEVYRSRIFNKRQKSRQSKRASTIHRVDSNSNGSLNKIGQPIDNINLNQFSGCCDLLNDFHTGMSSIATGGVERRLSSSSSKASLTRNQAANSNHDRILSMETDQFELMLNNLTLTYEDQLLNVLTEYFLSKEDSGLYSCSRMIRDGESLPTSQSFDNSGLSRMKKFASVSEFRENGWNKNPSGVLNRCYYASIQAHMAQSFKAMDTNFDNRLSFDEFYNGLRTVLNENCVRKLCAKSYYKFVLNLVNDETVLKRLFAKFDVNNDEYVDFSEFIRCIPIPMCQKRIKVLNEAFDSLDADQDNYLGYYDFDSWFRNNHPCFKDRPRNDERLTKVVLTSMINFNGKEEPLKAISREKFVEYYKVVSSTIMNDAYFDLFIRKIHLI